MNSTVTSSIATALQLPIVQNMVRAQPVVWNNPQLLPINQAIAHCPFSAADVADATNRLQRFAPYLALVFPQTAPQHGIVESPLKAIPHMQAALEKFWHVPIKGTVMLKMDSHLPVSGSIKARGGFYEVLAHAEKLALKSGLLHPTDCYSKLASPECKEFFATYSLAVGSTGNLGLSVGIMGATLGFSTTVHMSSDARQWKKDTLRSLGVTVIEYAGDYSEAVAAGRAEAEKNPLCYFVDDENSRNLFLGYAVAGKRLKDQLAAQGITPTPKSPLHVYLPCGVGGGPGGVAFGLKLAFEDAVHCYFAEPTHSPAVILGLATGLNSAISADDLQLDGITAADGLAVSRPSEVVCQTMHHILDGAFTVGDKDLFAYLALIHTSEDIQLEPSALAGVPGILHTVNKSFSSTASPEKITHIVWATGGSLVPQAEWNTYLQQGLPLITTI